MPPYALLWQICHTVALLPHSALCVSLAAMQCSAIVIVCCVRDEIQNHIPQKIKSNKISPCILILYKPDFLHGVNFFYILLLTLPQALHI
jgi:hypothetical protein